MIKNIVHVIRMFCDQILGFARCCARIAVYFCTEELHISFTLEVTRMTMMGTMRADRGDKDNEKVDDGRFCLCF